METDKPNKGSSLRAKLKRVGKFFAVLIIVLVLLVWAASWYIDWFCCARPPEIGIEHPILSKRVYQADDGYKHLGECYLGKRNGILRMSLSGDPFSLGYCNSALVQELMKEQEVTLFETIKQHVPSAVNRWLLKKYVLLRNRKLPEFVPRCYQVEIYGLSLGYEDPFPDVYPLYHRILNYHAAHDISHIVMDSPLVGCTSFAGWGGATSNRHVLLGRNFDFDAGRCFDENKVVMHFKPDEGLEFISVAWPGMIGVISGINEAKIAVTINAACSADSRTIGMPVSLLIRDIMQHASTLKEAIDIIVRSDVFVSDSYLVADGKTDQVVVVEKTPSRSAVRTAIGDYIICSNHFLSDELKNDKKNVSYMAEGTSVQRYNRMEELVRMNHGLLTPELAVEILRDRRVPQCDKPGLGNDAAINPLIATHSVVIDVTDGIIWVSASPHQLGKFVPFSLDNFEEPGGADEIAADPILENGEYNRYLRSKDLLSQAKLLQEKDLTAQAAVLIRKAQQLNPNFYLPHLLLGKIAFQAERWEDAKRLLSQAQSLYPPFASERMEITEMLRRIDKRDTKRKN